MSTLPAHALRAFCFAALNLPLTDRESYAFDPAAGMAVATATDGRGNRVSFTHGDSAMAQATGVVDVLAGRCADPTAFTNALGAVTRFVYEPAFRLLTQTTDPLGRIACRVLDGPGRWPSAASKRSCQALVSSVAQRRRSSDFHRKPTPSLKCTTIREKSCCRASRFSSNLRRDVS